MKGNLFQYKIKWSSEQKFAMLTFVKLGYHLVLKTVQSFKNVLYEILDKI